MHAALGGGSGNGSTNGTNNGPYGTSTYGTDSGTSRCPGNRGPTSCRMIIVVAFFHLYHVGHQVLLSD